MELFWFSFSGNGENIGICIVEEDHVNSAWAKVEKLGLNPEEADHIQVMLMTKLDDGLVVDRFYTKAEMEERGYTSIKTTIKNG